MLVIFENLLHSNKIFFDKKININKLIMRFIYTNLYN